MKNNIKIYGSENFNKSYKFNIKGYILTLMQRINELDENYVDIKNIKFEYKATSDGWYDGELDLITKKEETKQVKVMLLNNYCNYYEEWKENPNIEIQYYDLEINDEPIKIELFKFIGNERDFIKIKKIHLDYLEEIII